MHISITEEELLELLELAYKDGWYGCLELAEETADGLMKKHLEKKNKEMQATYMGSSINIGGITLPGAGVVGNDPAPTIHVDWSVDPLNVTIHNSSALDALVVDG